MIGASCLRRMMPRNKNGSGRSCRRQLNIFVTDEHMMMVNSLQKKYNLSKSDLIRKLIEDKFNEKNDDIF